jgi:F-type H+-transporting ATPase subunit delta
MSTHADALSNVYARSLYELAEQAGGRAKIEEVALELQEISELARADKTFREFLVSPIIGQDRRSESLRRILADRVTDLTLRFILVLNAKNRLSGFEAMADAFDSMVQEAFGKIEVDLFTAAPLGPQATETIRSRIASSLSKEPVLHSYTEPAMIGGLKLRIGDRLIDGSVATRLRRMKQSLMSSGSTLRDDLSRFIKDA